MLLFSSFYGIQIISRWDLKNGSELQLSLEKKTYLISSIITYAFIFQALSLFLFIYTTDRLSSMFTGAMCAAGTLQAGKYGYTVLILKLINFILAGIWLILNHTDNKAHDYPIIKEKNILQLLIMPVVLCETVLQTMFFSDLDADIITSCCGSLFSSEGRGLIAGISTISFRVTKAFFLTGFCLFFFSGIFYLKTKRGLYFFSINSVLLFIISVIAIISYISPYYYELPTHRCPFCILKAEYGYTGYLFYFTSLTGIISGISAGLLHYFRKRKSLKTIIPDTLKKLVLYSMLSFLIILLSSGYKIVFSNLLLE